MRDFLAFADSMQRDVALDARPLGGGMVKERLEVPVAFYERFAFVTLEHGVTKVRMVRRRRA